MERHDSRSPTVHNDSVMMTMAIESEEQRDVAVADIKYAYLHTKIDEFLLTRLVGSQVDVMVKIDSKFQKYVVQEGKDKVLYIMLNAGLYGTLQGALLWFKLLTSKLIDAGFKLNPCNLCVANKMINGKQCTIAFHVNDNKISHQDPAEVTEAIQILEDEFRKMKAQRGKTHDYLGMEITYHDNKKVSINIKTYLRKAIDGFGEEGLTKVLKPARS